MQASPSGRTYAILVDWDNPASAALRFALDHVEEREGDAKVRLMFGNGGSLGDPRDAILLGFRPVIQFAFGKGKNTADIALTIAAMDLLHTKQVDSFCIVSNDRDFHPLAIRLREAGCYVICIGTANASKLLRRSVHEFIEFEAPEPEENESVVEGAPDAPPAQDPQTPPDERTTHLHDLLTDAYRKSQNADDGWVSLSVLGMKLAELEPGFTPQKYHQSQLSKLIEGTNIFERGQPPSGAKDTVYVRLRTS